MQAVTITIHQFLGFLKSRINLILYSFDLASFFVMQAHLEWKKFQFKQSVIQSDNSTSNANDGGLINFKSGLYSFLSIVAFVGLLIGNIFLTGKRMGQNFYIVEFFTSGVVCFVAVPVVIVVKNKRISKFFQQKFIFVTRSKNRICPLDAAT